MPDQATQMAKKPMTSFELIKTPIEAIRVCVGTADSGELTAGTWEHGFLASDTVVYASGRIARRGDTVRHTVDPDELARCRTLAKATSSISPPYFPSSEGDFRWNLFYVASNSDEPIPERIDEALVRERFGGTINPDAPIEIQPIGEEGAWWTSVTRLLESRARNPADVWMERSFAGALALEEHGLDQYSVDKAQQKVGDPILKKLLGIPDGQPLTWSEVGTVLEISRLFRLIRFLRGPEFRDAAYVMIGMEMDHEPACKPVLVLGLTQGGSLTGLMGYTVLT
jgi:hypothetical protein